MRFLLRRSPRFGMAPIVAAMLCIVAIGVAFAEPRWLQDALLGSARSVLFARSAVAETADSVRVGTMSVRELAAANEALVEENARLRLQAALAHETRAALDRILDRFGRDTGTTGVIAAVLAAPARSLYDTFLIDAGSAQGVMVGDDVWFDRTIILGTVESVGERASRVRLLSSPETETMVSIGTTSSALFPAIGAGGGSFVLTIPKDVSVVEGDALMMPGVELGALGFVVGVVQDDSDPHQTVYATMPVNIFETREVMVSPSSRRDDALDRSLQP